MNEMKINVKAETWKGLQVNTFKVNEQKPQEIVPELVYLNENKFERIVRRLNDPEVQAGIIGIGALPFLPSILKVVQPELVTFFSPVASVVKDKAVSMFYSATNLLADGPKAVVVNGSVETVKRLNEIDLYKKLEPLIDIIQEIALPIGIIVCLWGCIEFIIGSPSYKSKVKGPIIGYCAVFGIPFIFKTIHDVLDTIA